MAATFDASLGEIRSTLTEWSLDTSPLEQLLVRGAQIPRAPAKNVSSVAPSRGSSMRASIHSGPQLSSLSSANVPSLIHTGSTISGTYVSRETRKQAIVQEGPTRTGSAPEPVHLAAESSSLLYQCAFYFLDCVRSFDSHQDCNSHTLTHFRGKQPPSTAQCPFCSEWKAETGPEAWAARMDHVAKHQRNGERLTSRCRPDRALYTHLKNVGVLNSIQYQELVQPRNVNADSNVFCEPNNPRRDRRNGMPVTASSRRPR